MPSIKTPRGPLRHVPHLKCLTGISEPTLEVEIRTGPEYMVVMDYVLLISIWLFHCLNGCKSDIIACLTSSAINIDDRIPKSIAN